MGGVGELGVFLFWGDLMIDRTVTFFWTSILMYFLVVWFCYLDAEYIIKDFLESEGGFIVT